MMREKKERHNAKMNLHSVPCTRGTNVTEMGYKDLVDQLLLTYSSASQGDRQLRLPQLWRELWAIVNL